MLGTPVLEWRSLPSRWPVQIQAELRPESGEDVNRRCLLVCLIEGLVSTKIQFPGRGVAPFILTPVTNQPSGDTGPIPAARGSLILQRKQDLGQG